MNWKNKALFVLALVFLAGAVASCAGDPRKNCNHPDHGRYMQEKIMKKRGVKL